jgi:prolyl-tRNA synthetase
MGCYGIGVTRIVGAAIEQNHDQRGIIWPEPIAPFKLAIIPIGYARSAAVHRAADELYRELMADGVDVMLDDRDERPGVLLADVELVGIPHRVVIGERGLKDGKIEYQGRRDASPTTMSAADVPAFLREKLCVVS